jgi:tetratricopeptide (TPR) repeat protein
VNVPLLIGILVISIVVLAGITYIVIRTTETRRKPRSRDRHAVIREANRALAQNPKDADALNALAEVYYAEKDWAKAAKTYSVLIDLVAANPQMDEDEILLRHGLSSMQIGQTDEAYRSLVLARKGNEAKFEINYNLGQIELQRRAYEKAVPLLRAAHDERPEHMPTAKALGQVYFHVKRHREAIALLKRVTDAEPDDKESIFTLGQAYYELGQNEAASRIFGHLRPDPVYGPRSALMAGSIHLKSHAYDEAELDFQIGLKHEKMQPEILLELKYRLAATYTRKNQLDRAIDMLRQIAQVNPAYKDVAAQIERSRELAGNENLRVFLVAPTSEFIGLCRRIVLNYFPKSKTKIVDISVGRTDYTDILAEIHTAKWEDIVVFRFVRSSGTVGELVLRDLHSRIKDLHAGRGFCVSAGDYSESGQEFVEARLIDLLGKPELNRLLNRI